MSDMYYDPASFNFDDLKDVIITDEPITKPVPAKAGPDGGKVEDISDLADLFADEDTPEPEQEAEPDLNADVSDLVPEESQSEALTIFNDLPDSALVTFNGKEMTKAEANEVFAMVDQLKQEREVVSTAANSIEQIHRFIEQDYHRHATAIDANIAHIQQKMNSNISAVEYGEEARKLQSALEARNELNQRTDEKMRLLDLEKAELTKQRLYQTDVAMVKDIPQWLDRRGAVLKYAQDQGMNLNELEKVWSAPLAKALYHAYAFTKQRSKVETEALERAKAKAPRSTASAANAQRQKAADAKEIKRQQLLAKQAKHGLDRDGMAQMFEFLKD
ncbi:hypothetical protein CDG24_25205 [Salmonella enterica subsp. enterica serovar Newport]|nr:hypothetical protein [Salmonella enterica subsp. enterica serovar Newport]